MTKVIENQDSKLLKLACPNPQPLLILNANQPFIVASEFNSAQISLSQQTLNHGVPNKGYIHSFKWSPRFNCCQIVGAKLKLKVKALNKGSIGGSDSGNDTISFIHNGGQTFPGTPQIIFNPPVNSGVTITKLIPILGSSLNYLNTNKLLNVYIQDDTSVISAELHLSICCLDKI